jgi:glycogen operon protein
VFLNGDEIVEHGARGEDVVDDSFLLLVNAGPEDVTFRLPNRRYGVRWTLELSTADPEAETGSLTVDARAEVGVMSRSVLLLKRTR